MENPSYENENIEIKYFIEFKRFYRIERQKTKT